MKNGFNSKKRNFLSHSLIALWILYAPAINAQTITENASLTFGKIVITDNSSARSIEMLSNGGYIADPQYIFFTEPQRANITVEGYNPFTTLSVSISSPTLNRSGGGPAFFSISDVFTNPAIIETDSVGSATFEVGATLSSNGNGAGFTNNDYEGNYTVTITP